MTDRLDMKDINPRAPGPHHFTFGRHTLHYEVHGDGPRVVVYMHGLLLDAQLNHGLAHCLSSRGVTVVLFDLLGHGHSDKPAHASEYRMDTFARQLAALLDHLGVEDAVVGGISLGANVALEAAAAEASEIATQATWPGKIRGLLLEMPVLEWAAPAAALTFAPLVVLLRYGKLAVSALTAVARRMPRTGIAALDSVVTAASAKPDVMAAILHGILLGPVAPTREERQAISVPTLVFAHRFDMIHPLDDARNLVRQLPHARLVTASPVVLRVAPERYAGEIVDFLDEVWGGDTPAAISLQS